MQLKPNEEEGAMIIGTWNLSGRGPKTPKKVKAEFFAINQPEGAFDEMEERARQHGWKDLMWSRTNSDGKLVKRYPKSSTTAPKSSAPSAPAPSKRSDNMRPAKR